MTNMQVERTRKLPWALHGKPGPERLIPRTLGKRPQRGGL